MRKMERFESFKEISVGGVSKGELIQSLVGVGIQFNDYAKTLFDHPAFIPEESVKKFNLVRLSVSDLGLKNPFSHEEVLLRASKWGLELCPLVLAAFLRLEYLDQPEGPYLTVASSRVIDDETFPTGFYLRRFENVLWLRGYRAIGECDHPLNNEYVFLG